MKRDLKDFSSDGISKEDEKYIGREMIRNVFIPDYGHLWIGMKLTVEDVLAFYAHYDARYDASQGGKRLTIEHLFRPFPKLSPPKKATW